MMNCCFMFRFRRWRRGEFFERLSGGADCGGRRRRYGRRQQRRHVSSASFMKHNYRQVSASRDLFSAIKSTPFLCMGDACDASDASDADDMFMLMRPSGTCERSFFGHSVFIFIIYINVVVLAASPLLPPPTLATLATPRKNKCRLLSLVNLHGCIRQSSFPAGCPSIPPLI